MLNFLLLFCTNITTRFISIEHTFRDREHTFRKKTKRDHLLASTWGENCHQMTEIACKNKAKFFPGYKRTVLKHRHGLHYMNNAFLWEMSCPLNSTNHYHPKLRTYWTRFLLQVRYRTPVEKNDKSAIRKKIHFTAALTQRDKDSSKKKPPKLP